MERLLRRGRAGSRELNTYYNYILLYLTILSSSGLSLRNIFHAMEETNISAKAREVFRRLVNLIEGWNYDLVKACQLMGKEIGGRLGQLLIRLAHVIDLGVEPKDYFPMEYEVHVNRYVDEYGRALERLRRIIDAYAAVMSSLSFSSATLVLLLSFYSTQSPTTILATSALVFVAPLATLVLLTYRSLDRFPALVTIERPVVVQVLEMSAIMAPSTLFLFAAASQFIKLPHLHEISTVLLPPGLLSLSMGYLGSRMLRRVRGLEEGIYVFIKSFCDAYGITQSIPKALDILRLHDYGALTPLINRMFYRSLMRIELDTLFKLFSLESLSERVRVTMEILRSGITHGAVIKELSNYLANYTIIELNLNKRRDQMASYLTGLALPLQGVLAVVAALVLVLVELLNEVLSLATNVKVPLPIVNFQLLSPVPEALVAKFYVALLASTSLTTALMAHASRGEAMVNLTYYLGLALVISSVSFQVTYELMSMVLGNLAGPIRGMVT